MLFRSPPSRRRILVIEDHPLMRAGIATWINNAADLTVCAEAGSAAAGVQLINAEAVAGVEGPVAFLHPKSCNGVLIELIEAPGGPAWKRLGFGAPGELRIR